MDDTPLTLRQKAERYRRLMQEQDDKRLKEAADELAVELEQRATEVERLAAEFAVTDRPSQKDV